MSEMVLRVAFSAQLEKIGWGVFLFLSSRDFPILRSSLKRWAHFNCDGRMNVWNAGFSPFVEEKTG